MTVPDDTTRAPDEGHISTAFEIPGSRCVLRPFVESDAGSLARHADDREIWLNLRDGFPHPYTTDDARAYIAHASRQSPVTSLATVVDGNAVGGVSLRIGSDIERFSAEIGYWLGREYWGRGIVSEVVRLATRHAFEVLGMKRVFAVPFVRNVASHRVLDRAGYVLEGTMRHSAVKEGALIDQHLYAACADQWEYRVPSAGTTQRAGSDIQPRT